MKFRLPFALLMAITLATSSLQAQKKKERPDPTDRIETDPLADMTTAYSLIEYGRAAQSPLALLTAADILRRVKLDGKPLEARGILTIEEEPLKKVEVVSDEAPSFHDESNKLLDEVKMMSRDAHILALADEIAALKQRGSTLAQKFFGGTLPPGASVALNIGYKPGAPVHIALVSNPKMPPTNPKMKFVPKVNVRLHVFRTYSFMDKSGTVRITERENVGNWTGLQIRPSAGPAPAKVNHLIYHFHVRNTSNVPVVYHLFAN